MANELSEKAAELGAAIAEHARVLEASPDDAPRVIQAVNALRTAALEYGALCLDRTGWGNPLSALEEDLEEEAQEGEPDTASVDVEAHYRVRVNDPDAVARLLGEQAQEDVEGATAADLVTQLFVRDGWDPDAYGDDLVTVVSQSWSCGPAEKES
ncbi:hypothetical protein [Nonomuraea sp. CA-141351]|uniref:hypothetical protein n=1 Tax=Nonomuraea sp. CA-141351 TaxID=3239996 RepID=UPI003D94008B